MINNCYLPGIKRHHESAGGQNPRRHWALHRVSGGPAKPQTGVIRLRHVVSLHSLSCVPATPKTQRPGHPEQGVRQPSLGAAWLCEHGGQLGSTGHLTATPWTYVSCKTLFTRTPHHHTLSPLPPLLPFYRQSWMLLEVLRHLTGLGQHDQLV